jgi:hypothetical protein
VKRSLREDNKGIRRTSKEAGPMMKKLIEAIDKVIDVLDVESKKTESVYDRYRHQMYQ